jgi:hypothetical protein
LALPRVRDALRIDPLPDGEFAVVDGEGQRVLVVNDEGLFLLLRLDGLQTWDELAAAFAAAFDQPLARPDVEGWTDDLRAAGLIADDSAAVEAVRYLAEQGVRYRRFRDGGERRRDEQDAARFDWGIFLVNEGRIAEAAAAFAERAAERPGDVRAATIAGHLEFLVQRQAHGLDRDRRDPERRAFDDALRQALTAGRCPRCDAPFDVELGRLNRCDRCGAHFSTHVLEPS